MATDLDLNIGDLAQRERALRETILGRHATAGLNDRHATAGLAKQVVPTPSPAKPEASELDLDPETAELLYADLFSGKLVTTIGKFDLSEVEQAQIAYIALQAVQRNLGALLDALGEKYNIPALTQMVERQKQELIAAVTRTADSTTTESREPEFRTSAQQLVDVDEIDEEVDLPPTPTNRRRPKRK